MVSKNTKKQMAKIFFFFFIIFAFFLIFFDSVEAKTYEVNASCSYKKSHSAGDWPAVVAPACSPDFDEYHYSDRLSPGVALLPADYDAATSDPWISSLSSSLYNVGYNFFYAGCTSTLSCRTSSSNPGIRKRFSLYDDNNNTIASSTFNSSSSGWSVFFTCAYRICVEQNPCQRDSSPACDTPGPCQELPGECVVQTDGSEACKFADSSTSCDADGDDCTVADFCSSTDGGITSTCVPGGNFCGGIVPCGRLANNPETSWNDTDSCGLCHLVILASEIINFLMEIVALISVLALIIGGLIYVKTAGDASLLLLAKQNINKIFYGFVVVFVAWVIVNIAMVLFGFIDPLGDGSWKIFSCNL